MIDVTRYTSGRIAVANLSATIDALERRRSRGADCDELSALSKALFVRGDLLGRLVDHDRAELAASDAFASCRDRAVAYFIRAQVCARFHRFEEAGVFLDRARRAGYDQQEIDGETAALLQATGKYPEALLLRKKLARVDAGIHTLGSLASLLAEMGEWAGANARFADALDADDGVSPIPCAQLLFEWGVFAMRQHDFERADDVFAALQLILPAHVPGPGHRAELALARGELDRALALIVPILEISDDPEYRATHAEVLMARGERQAAAREAARAASAYDRLLARRPEAYADHAAAFFMGVGDAPQRAIELAMANWKLRDTPRSRGLVFRAQQYAVGRNFSRRIA